MAGVPGSELKKYEGFPAGINNILPEHSVGRNALRAAVNVDIDDTGRLSRRAGTTLISTLPGLHSLFADRRFPYMLAADADTLYSFDETLTPTVVTALTRNADMSYAVNEFGLFYSNGTDTGHIDLAGQRTAWSAPMPAGQPLVGVNALAGGLNAGEYQVAITFFDAQGRESGAHNATVVDVPEGGGIVLQDWPEMSADVAHIGIYMSPANGDMMYQAEILAAPMSTPYLLGRRILGRALDTLFLTPMPPCTLLCMFNGRMLGNYNGTVVWSESINPGLTKRHENWIQFPSVTLIAAAGQDGIFIASENRTYFMEGADPAVWKRRIVHASGAVRNTLTYVNASDLNLEAAGMVAVWMDTRGELIAGLTDGSVLRLHKDTYAGAINAEKGSIALREYDGIRQLIATHTGGFGSKVRAGDSVSVEVCRNGVIVE